MRNKVNYYLNLPYSVIIRRCEDGVFEARIAELDGCLSHGNTEEEALKMIEDAKRAWIEANLEEGDSIPEPDYGYFSQIIKLYDLHLRSA